MGHARSLLVPILAAMMLMSCGTDEAEPFPSPSPTAAATTSPAASPDDRTSTPVDGQLVDGLVEVVFADITLTATPTRCGFDPDAEAPADGSPRTVLDVLAAGPGPDGATWDVHVSRTLIDGAIIETVSVHSTAGLDVDRYEAQRVMDTAQQEVEDLWGDSTNALLIAVVNGDELTVHPPDEVTFGVYPAEREEPPAISGTGTFSVTCSPAG